MLRTPVRTTIFALGVATAFAITGCGQGQQDKASLADVKANTITQHIEQVATPPEVLAKIKAMSLSTFKFKTPKIDTTAGVDIGSIVNLGKDVWTIVDQNQPVLDVKYDYATALPYGIKSAAQLEGFTDLQHQSFRVHGTNGFGMNVYDLTYTLVHQYNGTYQGKGHYLASVSVIPSNISALWGYKVYLTVGNVAATNVGTADAPIGAANMDLTFRVETILKKSQTTTVYEFRGDTRNILSTQL